MIVYNRGCLSWPRVRSQWKGLTLPLEKSINNCRGKQRESQDLLTVTGKYGALSVATYSRLCKYATHK